MTATPSHAQQEPVIQLEGTADNMQVRLENAPVPHVLAELARKYGLLYKQIPNIGRHLSGQYSGHLKQVLARILDGNDYIVEMTGQSVNVVFLRTGSPTAQLQPTVATSVQNAATPPIPPASADSRTLAPPAGQSGAEVPPLASFLTENGASSGR